MPETIADVVAELSAASAILGSALHPTTAANLAALVRIMNTLIRGQFERGEAPRITGLPERTARRVLNDVITDGLLVSSTPKAPMSLYFPTVALETLFPRLYPEV